MTFAFSSTQVRAIVFVTIAALLAWSMGLPLWSNQATAANIVTFSDTLSTSEPGVDATHTIQFNNPNAWNSNESFVIRFDPVTDAFDPSAITFSDITLGNVTLVDTGLCAGGTEIEFINNGASDGEFLEFRVCAGDTVAASTTLDFTIGGTNEVTNPTATTTSYIIRVAGTGTTPIADSGDTRVAIVDTVTVTAAVDTTLTFSVLGIGPDFGVNSTSTVNNDADGLTGTTTPATIPFGTLTPDNTRYLMAQRLEVTTNAREGYTVTVFADQTLTASNGADIDTFIEGANTASATDWVDVTQVFGDNDTYGHWALTSDDDNIGSTTMSYGGGAAATYYVGNFVNNPVPVMYHNGPVDVGNFPLKGQSYTYVGYKVAVDSLQEAANDYTSTLTYIATPVF